MDDAANTEPVWEVEFVAESAALAAVPAPPPTQQRTLADLVAEVIGRGKSERTRLAYRADLADFLAWRLGRTVLLPNEPELLRTDIALAADVNAALAAILRVTEADISAYLRTLRDSGAQPATINRRLTPLRLLFARLQRYRFIADNPLEDIKGDRLSNVSTTLWLSRSQARDLEEACSGPTLKDLRDRALIVLMLATGVRSSEALSLTTADIGRVDGHNVAFVRGKGGARERVKLQPRARKLLDAYLTAAEVTEGAIFRRLRHRALDAEKPTAPRRYAVHGPLSYSGLYYILTERFKAAGLDDELAAQLSPHSLRHSFVTLALKGGAPLPKVQAAARHRNPTTTQRYAHEQDELDQNAVDFVNW